MKPKLLLLSLAFVSAAAFALPSSEDVQTAVKAGDYAKAESMMQEVVTAKPQSAKAHYIYAEILAHDAKFDDAARQARQAQQIDPSIGFTDPARFRSFEQELQREQGGQAAAPRAVHQGGVAPAPYAPERAGGMPGWVWGLGFAIVALLIYRMVARRAQTVVMPAAAYGAPAGGAGYGPGYGAGPGYGPGYGPTPGGSALRTGLAAAGGLAGGMLLEKYLEGERGENHGGGVIDQGGFDNGAAQAAADLENRQIDFGNGNDWGGGASSDNFTPSGDDGGGW